MCGQRLRIEAETKMIVTHSCGKRVRVDFNLLVRGPICPTCKKPLSISTNLERLITRLRTDGDFANITVSRHGANLRGWRPPSTEEEMGNALLAARFLMS